MRYDSLKQLSAEEFRRLTGVKPKTFGAMHAILHIAEQDKHATGGVPAKLVLEDRLLMALEYWQELRSLPLCIILRFNDRFRKRSNIKRLPERLFQAACLIF